MNGPDKAADTLVSIIGGGAIGGLLAALLARAGRPVELIVRADQLSSFAADLRVTTAAGTFRQPVAVRTAPSPASSLVIVTVKMPDLEAVCRTLAEREPADTPREAGGNGRLPAVALVQNGLAALDIASHHLPVDRLYGVIVELGATALVPAEITYSIPGKLVLGAASADGAATTQHWAAVLRSAVPTVVVPDLRRAQRLKLIVNLNNGVGAATGLTVQQLYASDAGVRLSLLTMREGLGVLDAAGLSLPATARTRLLRGMLALPDPVGHAALRLSRLAMRQRAPVYVSTLQSLLRHRPTEIRWLNGEIVRLGQQHGRPTPWNSAIVATVTAIENGEPRAAFVTPEAFLAGRSGGTVPATVRRGAT